MHAPRRGQTTCRFPGRTSVLYSPECVQGEFYELRHNGVLRSSRRARRPPDEVSSVGRAQANPKATRWLPGPSGEQTGWWLCPQPVCSTLISPSVSDGPFTVTSFMSPTPAA